MKIFRQKKGRAWLYEREYHLASSHKSFTFLSVDPSHCLISFCIVRGFTPYASIFSFANNNVYINICISIKKKWWISFLIKKIIYYSNWGKKIWTTTHSYNNEIRIKFLFRKKKILINSLLVMVQNSKISKEQTLINWTMRFFVS